jgi:mRNA interferase MazF
MMDLNAFDVVKVPFPFTDKTASKNRPALVLSSAAAFNSKIEHSVMAMITSSTQMPWPLDCAVTNLEAAGLPAPSLIRFKLFTLDHRLVRAKLGHLSDEDRFAAQEQLRRLLPES